MAIAETEYLTERGTRTDAVRIRHVFAPSCLVVKAALVPA
jgi:hypothetical protein